MKTIIRISSAIWFSVIVATFAQDLTLTHDAECEKLARCQIFGHHEMYSSGFPDLNIGRYVFWKVSLKKGKGSPQKNLNLRVSIREVGKLAISELAHLPMSEGAEYLALTSYNGGHEPRLLFNFFTKEGNAWIDGVSMPSDFSFDDLSIPKEMQISEKTEGHISPDPRLSDQNTMGYAQGGNLMSGSPPPKPAPTELPLQPKIRKKYELVLQIDHRELLNTEIRSNPSGSP